MEQKRQTTSSRLDDLTGKRFGLLTVIEKAESRSTPSGSVFTYWKCVCDCGNISDVRAHHLKRGKIKSCGCGKTRTGTDNHNYKHGRTHERLYGIWNGMKARCYRKSNSRYKNYGARNIKVCDEWKNDYEAFREWAYENGYDENAEYMQCTIDRIDVNGDYEPSNCRWVDVKVQTRNKTNNIYITYKGETKIIKDWARQLGTDSGVLKRRLQKGWTIEDTIETPIRRNAKAS